jgi:methionyl-tRNA synthetase
MESTAETAELAKQFGFTINKRALAKALKELEEFEHEAREIRAKSADWEYIEKQPDPLRAALRLLVESGDLRLAAHIAGIPLDELDEHRIKAKIPLVL